MSAGRCVTASKGMKLSRANGSRVSCLAGDHFERGAHERDTEIGTSIIPGVPTDARCRHGGAESGKRQRLDLLLGAPRAIALVDLTAANAMTRPCDRVRLEKFPHVAFCGLDNPAQACPGNRAGIGRLPTLTLPCRWARVLALRERSLVAGSGCVVPTCPTTRHPPPASSA